MTLRPISVPRSVTQWSLVQCSPVQRSLVQGSVVQLDP
jgi:hypothetical protein